MRIADAIVCARSLAWPPISRSVAPSSANPFAYAVMLPPPP
jgi:hypothetical protein